MWTTLSLLVLGASTSVPAPPVELLPGTRVRLGAGPTVHVPGLFSGTDETFTRARLVEKRDGLLIFNGGDGEPEAVLAPNATVEGTLVGADPVYVYLRQGDGGAAERIRRASVARVHAVLGTERPAAKGALVGGAAGAALGLGSYLALTRPGTDWPSTPGGAAAVAGLGAAAGLAVGAAVGALSTGDDWREVPLEALPGAAAPPAATAGSRGADAHDAATVSWEVVSLGDGPGLTLTLLPRTEASAPGGPPKTRGPLREAVAHLGNRAGAER